MKKAVLFAAIMALCAASSHHAYAGCPVIVSKSITPAPNKPSGWWMVDISWTSQGNDPKSISVIKYGFQLCCMDATHSGSATLGPFYAQDPSILFIRRYTDDCCTDQCGVDISLPIDLISFTARPEGASVRLDWKVAIESLEYGSFFEIQYSTNGRDFSTAATMDADLSKDEYFYAHHPQLNGASRAFYRLWMDQKRYSPIRSVAFQITPGIKFTYVNGNVFLYGSVAGTVSEVWSVSGQRILQKRNETTLDVSNAPSGMYLLIVTSSQGEPLLKERFIKQ